ncbi:MAG: hypothetical protein ACJAZV_002436, partial [Roseivirga sp.]
MKKLLTVIILMFGLSNFALLGQQKVAFMGEVRDSLGFPLEFANVLALDTVKKSIASFGVTNKQGQFRLSLEENKVYKLKASFIGFLPYEKVFTAKDNGGVPVLITLRNDVQQLGDVEVVTEMPILIQGDTITYKADVFTQGNERKLGDVLADLPGFKVDENGEVTVQGKKVDKLLVDGKEFFEGDTKLATKNLPANVVDKVQVLQNFNDISPLSGVNSSEQLALNIQLKGDKKNLVFGDLELGGGPEGRFRGHANAFYYNPKTNINLIADANNVGELAFTTSDFFRFNGGFGSLSSRAGSGFQVSSNQLGIPMAERNNAQELNNQLAALNYNLRPNDKISFSGFAIGAKTNNTFGSRQLRSYVLQPGNNQEILTSTQQAESDLGLLKFAAKYTPNASLQLDYSIFSRLSDISNRENQISNFNNSNNLITGVTSQAPVSVEQQLRGFYAPDNKNVFSFEASYQYQNQDPTYDLMASQQPFTSILPLTGSSPFNLIQLKEVRTNKQEAALNYYRILNKTNHINFKVGNNYTSQSLSSGMIERLNSNTENAVGGVDFNNLVDYTFQDYYAGIMYRTKLGKLTFSPALNLHYYDVENTQNGEVEGFNKTLLLPAVNAKYQFGSSHSLSLAYNIGANFTDIQNVAKGLLVNSYNSLFAGNPNLENSWYHNFSLNYFKFNMYNFFNVYGGMSYQRSLDDVTNIIQFNGLERVNSPINIAMANESLTGYVSSDKRFDSWTVNVAANWNRSVSNNQISDIANQNVNFRQTYEASIRTVFLGVFQFEFGYDLTLSGYEGGNQKSKFQNHKPNVELDIEFLKGFRFNIDYEYNQYINKSNSTETFYDLLNAELTYRKEKSKWEFKAEGMNLINTTGIRRDSFSESLISTFE